VLRPASGQPGGTIGTVALGGSGHHRDRDWDGTREPLPAGPDPGITLTCPPPRRPSHLRERS